MPKKKIGEVLVEKKLVSKAQIDEILKEQERSKKLIGELLVEKQLLSEILLYQALAFQHQMAFVDLEAIKLNAKLLEKIPFELIEEYTMLPIDLKDQVLVMAVSSPRCHVPKEELTVLTNAKEVQCVLSLPAQIEDVIRENFQ